MEGFLFGSEGSLTKEQILERFSEFVTSEERLSEGFELHAQLKNMPTRIEVGSEWYFLPKAWLDKWETWCYVDVITCPVDDSSVNLQEVERVHPKRIKFSDLFLPIADNQIEDQQLKSKW